jgi:DHA1 family inner membrane transport protein
MAWLLLWGITAAGDSPQFSTLTAQNAPPEMVGSVLAFANSIGFAITVLSIELFVHSAEILPLATLLPWLALGPALGLYMLQPLWRSRPAGKVHPLSECRPWTDLPGPVDIEAPVALTKKPVRQP